MGVLIGLVVLALVVMTVWGVRDGIAQHKRELVDPDAQHNLGCGFIEQRKFALAEQHFWRAFQLGNVNSAYNLGIMYSQGMGVAKDQSKAFWFYEKAAEGGVANAQFNLAVMTFSKLPQQSDYGWSECYRWLVRAAEQGHPQAQQSVALFDKTKDRHWDGDGIVPEEDVRLMRPCVKLYWRYEARATPHARSAADAKRYIDLLERAMDYGDSEAPEAIALLYREGKSVPRDLEKAFAWMKLAADMDNSRARFLLPLFAPHREPTEGDLKNHIDLHDRAFKQGDKAARFEIAMRYIDGEGHEKDLREATYWLWLSENPADPAWRRAALSIPEDQWKPDLKHVRNRAL